MTPVQEALIHAQALQDLRNNIPDKTSLGELQMILHLFYLKIEGETPFQ
jgi:hypothetical protein